MDAFTSRHVGNSSNNNSNNLSLRDKQISALKTMLSTTSGTPSTSSLNNGSLMKKKLSSTTTTTTASDDTTWKVLVYDVCGQDIISPLLKVGELRALGVTLYMKLHSDRSAIPDVPAVYFIMPTKENVDRVCRDLRDGLYEAFSLNFIAPITRNLLEDIATAALDAGVVDRVSRVFDQYLNFTTYDERLFVLRPRIRESVSYLALNDSTAKDTAIEASVDAIVDSLFSVLVTLGTVPVIRSPRGNAAEMVARRLDTKLRDHLKNTSNNLFSQATSVSFARPVLLLLDRGIDLTTILHHTWTYQSLVHDVLRLTKNRVNVDVVDDSGQPTLDNAKVYDMDTRTDSFWRDNAAMSFPEVAEEVELQLNEYQRQAEEMTRISSALDMGDGDGTSNGGGTGTDMLNAAISSLPELTAKKAALDMHTTVASALLRAIKGRSLDAFFAMEQQLATRSTPDRPVAECIADSSFGTGEDRLRMFLVHYLSDERLSESEASELAAALGDSANVSPFHALRKMRAFRKMTSFASTPTSSATTGSGGVFSRVTNKVLAHGSSLLSDGVRNLIMSKNDLPVTRITEAIMENREASRSETDDYLYLDPKLSQSSADGSVSRIRTPFHDAIVFMVGGGTYVEMHNLNQHMRESSGHSHRNVTYGATEMLNATEFLRQLSELSAKMLD